MGGKGYGWDDWTILLCLIVLIPQNILLTIMLDLGLGKDMWMLEPPQITGVLFVRPSISTENDGLTSSSGSGSKNTCTVHWYS